MLKSPNLLAASQGCFDSNARKKNKGENEFCCTRQQQNYFSFL